MHKGNLFTADFTGVKEHHKIYIKLALFHLMQYCIVISPPDKVRTYLSLAGHTKMVFNRSQCYMDILFPNISKMPDEVPNNLVSFTNDNGNGDNYIYFQFVCYLLRFIFHIVVENIQIRGPQGKQSYKKIHVSQLSVRKKDNTRERRGENGEARNGINYQEYTKKKL